MPLYLCGHEMKLPTFSFTPFSSLQLLGLALCVGYECLFFPSFLLISELSGAKKKTELRTCGLRRIYIRVKILIKAVFRDLFSLLPASSGPAPNTCIHNEADIASPKSLIDIFWSHLIFSPWNCNSKDTPYIYFCVVR